MEESQRLPALALRIGVRNKVNKQKHDEARTFGPHHAFAYLKVPCIVSTITKAAIPLLSI